MAEIADDLSAVFGAKPETVQEQVLHMVRVLGHQGMLEGIVPFQPEAAAEDPAAGESPETLESFPDVPPTT